MKVIYKYILDVNREQSLELSIDSEILSVQMQGGNLCLWAMVNEELPKVKRNIHIYGTGITIHEDNLQYVGTVQDGDYVWHVFIENV
jgi:hypothetical protein